MIREIDHIKLDLDRDRIREIVSEALRMLHEYLGGEFARTDEQIMESLNNILNNGMISTQFFLELGSKKIPDLTLRVDPKLKKVLCKSSFRKKVAQINYFMRIL